MSDRPSTGRERTAPPPPDRAGRQPMRRTPTRSARAGAAAPNYAMRRAGTGAIVAAVVIVSIIVIGRAIGRDEGGSSAPAVDAAWNSVVTLTNDAIRVVDPASGDVVDEYAAVGSLLDDQSLVSGSMLVTMTDFGRIAITDLNDGSVRRGQAGTDETMLLSRDNAEVALVGSDSGGDLTVIDIAEREIVSVADAAGLTSPLMFATAAHVNPAGTHVAVSDGRSFQTIVLDLAESATIPLAGQIVAINDGLVVTAQRAGASTELEFYDLAGTRIGSVDLPTPVATMLTARDQIVAVDESGTVRVADARGVDEVGSLRTAPPEGEDGGDGEPIGATSGIAAGGNTRLLVTTVDGSIAILDDRGEQLTIVDEATSPITGFSRCMQAGGAFTGPSSIIDLDDGDVLDEFDGLIASTASVDGCTLAMLGSGGLVDGDPIDRIDDEATARGTPVWRDGDLILVSGRSIAAVAPDGRTVATNDGATTLLVDVDDGDTIELATEPVVVHFADR